MAHPTFVGGRALGSGAEDLEGEAGALEGEAGALEGGAGSLEGETGGDHRRGRVRRELRGGRRAHLRRAGGPQTPRTIRARSDIQGRNVIRFDGTEEAITKIVRRLKQAGCQVDDSGPQWRETWPFRHLGAYSRRARSGS
jgi:hypothetical protein